jgi:hypothetical protein
MVQEHVYDIYKHDESATTIQTTTKKKTSSPGMKSSKRRNSFSREKESEQQKKQHPHTNGTNGTHSATRRRSTRLSPTNDRSPAWARD